MVFCYTNAVTFNEEAKMNRWSIGSCGTELALSSGITDDITSVVPFVTLPRNEKGKDEQRCQLTRGDDWRSASADEVDGDGSSSSSSI